MELILASTSPYRKALLERLGVPFRCRPPLVDEETLKHQALTPRRMAESLAVAKARSLAPHEPQATILGGDQLVALGDQILGKPATQQAAVEQLFQLAGKTHELITATAVVHQGRTRLHVDVALLTMRPLSRDELQRYVAADRPLDCAGAYKLESRGVALFEKIEAADHSAITGLPLIAVTSLLREIGFAIP